MKYLNVKNQLFRTVSEETGSISAGFGRKFVYLLAILCLSVNSFAQTRVVAYIPTWINFPGIVNTADLTKVTHLNIAFANPNTSGVLSGVSAGNITTVVNAAHAKNVKVLISIGGAGASASTYKTLLANSTSSSSFVTKLVQYAVDNNLDGIDVDIEGDVLGGGNVTSSQYQTFVTQLGTGLHAKGKIMTSALATWFGSDVTNTAAAQFDFINVMSYDAAIPGTGDGAAQHSSYQFAVDDFNYWHNTKGVPGSKLTVGMPFYGYGWGSYAQSGNDEIAYSSIVSKYAGAENNDVVGSGSNAIYYNGIPTIKKKTTFAIANASGVMIWELPEDAPGAKSLLNAISEVINGSTPVNQAPTVSITSPANNASFTSPASITINANAADADGTVSKVEFYNGSTLLGSDATSPYSYSWTGVGAGTYSITAKATDNASATKTSTAVSVTVINPTLPIKEYTVNKTLSAITVDGVLNESGWVNAPATDNLLNMDGSAATQVTNAKMLWSDSYLYFAFTIQDNSMWSTLTARDAELYTQDVLEVLIDKDGDGVNYTEIGFAPNGTLYDLVMDKPYSAGGTANTAWNITNLQVKTTVTGTINTATGGVQWVVEAALPFAGIPATPATFGKPNAGDTWRLNFARADHNYNAASSEKLYTWTYTDGVTNHLPSRFGKVTFGNAVGNVAPTVSITSPANNASFVAPASITINATAADADGTVSKVDFYNGTTLLGSDASAPYSYSWTTVAAGNYSITAKATDNAGAVTTSSVIAVVVTTAPIVQSPYGGSAWAIPGKIQAENYDLGGQGVAFNETTTANQGGAYRTTEAVDVEACTDTDAGYNVGYVVAGEWLEYSVNVAAAGSYNLAVRVAATAAGKTFHIELDGANVSGTITVPNTTGWQIWQTVTINNIALTAGQKIMKIAFDSGDLNLNYVSFTTNAPNVAPTVSLTSPADGSSSNAPATIAIAATAADADGTVNKVDFYNGTTLLGTDATAPYTYSWTSVGAGSYTITAKATDNVGAATTSLSVTVTVISVPNVSPTITLTSPANNSSSNAPATVAIAATAADADGTVSKVDFYNGTTLLGTDATAPYSYSWTGVAADTYSITAKVTDNLGASTTSDAVSITVIALPNQAPTVTLTSPANNSSSNAPATIAIAATAADADGTVSKVDFYSGATLLFSDNSSPYSYSWTNVAAGTYSITAKATDNSGASTTSTAVSVTVNTVNTNTCSAIAQYVENGNYAAGSKVKNVNNQYQCKPYPYSGWCNGAAWAYGPGTGAYWTDAWTLVGSCGAARTADDASAVSATTISNSPNPFVSTTDIEVVVTEAGDVSVLVYNKTGQVVGTVVEGYLTAGTHTFTFDASTLKSDLYLVKYHSANGIATQKMIKVQ
ncbi:MAG: large protein [Chitinophagaceae bacterium]|nr:large protein [Chitinophagaceae bacterium]